MENKIKELIEATNYYFDINVPDVVAWIIDNKSELVNILNEIK